MAAVNPVYDREGEHIGWKVSIRKKGFPPQYKTFRTKAEALEWAAVIESEMVRGIWRDRSRAETTSVADLLDRYAREILPDKKSRQGPESVIRILTASELGRLSLAALSPEALAIYRDRRLKTVSKKTGRIMTSQTVRHEIALLSRVITHAIKEWGFPLPHGNPCLQIKMPAQATARTRRLINDEEKRLLAECDKSRNPWLRSVVIFAIETAMRAGEIVETWKQDPSGALDADGKRLQVKVSVGLQWADVDLKKRTAHLPKTKNGDARTVPLSSRAVATLEALPRNLNGQVFGTTYEGVHQAFVRACRRATINNLRFHDLRHEATSRLFEKGFNPMEVSAITGHKTLQMLKRYTHLRAEDLAKRMG